MSERIRSLCLFFLLLSRGLSPLASEEPVVSVFYYERLPFFGSVGTEEEGLFLRIARLVMDEAGVSYQFQKLPVSRLFDSLRDPGPYCIPGVFKTSERESLYLYSDFPIYQDSSPHYLIRKADASRFSGIHHIGDLLSSGQVLGAVDAYSYGTWVDENILIYKPKRVVVKIGSDQHNFVEMLVARRFDFFFLSLEEAVYLTARDPVFRDNLMVKSLDDSASGNIRWMLFSKGFPPELLQRINAAIPRVKEGKPYRELVAGMKKL